MSRHLEEVATSGRGRDINTESEAVETSECKEKKVATSSAKERRSRHQSEVATSLVKKGGRDIMSKRERSRHHQAVATTGARKRGRDIIQMSRHPLQRPEGRDNI